MSTIDTSGWTKIGSSGNADFYEVEPHILAVVPFEGTDDTTETATESVTIQLNYLRPRGVRAGIIVFMDPVAEQDAGARAVYRDLPDPTFQACFALVGSTMFGRAVGSVFLGLSRPTVPTKMFGTVPEAIAWIRKQLA